MTQPTPGNWIVDESRELIVTESLMKGDVIAMAPVPHPHSMDQWEANAPLLAASKDLYAVCESIRNQLPQMWGDRVVGGQITLTLDEDTIDALEEAIAKAKLQREGVGRG